MLSLSTSGRPVDASVVLGDSQSPARFEQHIQRYRGCSAKVGGTMSANLMKQVLLGDRTLTIRAIIHDVLNYELALYPCWVGKPEAHPVGLDPIVGYTRTCLVSNWLYAITSQRLPTGISSESWPRAASDQ